MTILLVDMFITCFHSNNAVVSVMSVSLNNNIMYGKNLALFWSTSFIGTFEGRTLKNIYDTISSNKKATSKT